MFQASKRQRVETSEEASTSRGSSGQGRSSGHRANPQSDKVQDRRQKKREENIRKLDNVLTRPKNVVTKIGSSGVPVQLMANFFRVSTGSNWILNNYRVDFEPEPAMTWEKRILIRRHEAVLRGFTFDGTNLYTPIHYSEQVRHLDYSVFLRLWSVGKRGFSYDNGAYYCYPTLDSKQVAISN